MAHTPTSDADIFDAVVIPPGYGGVPQGLSHQVSKQGVGLQEAQSDVGGFGEIPQERGIGEVHGSRASIYQRNYNLSILQRYNAGILGGADGIVIFGDPFHILQTKLFYAISLGRGKILPRLIRNSKIS